MKRYFFNKKNIKIKNTDKKNNSMDFFIRNNPILIILIICIIIILECLYISYTIFSKHIRPIQAKEIIKNDFAVADILAFNDYFYIINANTNLIQKFDIETMQIIDKFELVDNPVGIVETSNGNLAVLGRKQNNSLLIIYDYKNKSAVKEVIVDLPGLASGIVIDAEDILYIIDGFNKKVVKYNLSCEKIGEFYLKYKNNKNKFLRFSKVVVKRDILYIFDEQRFVTLYDKYGQIKNQWCANEIRKPSILCDIAVDDSNNIYISGDNENRVFIYDQNGKLKAFFFEDKSRKNRMSRPGALAVNNKYIFINASFGLYQKLLLLEKIFK